MAARFFVRLVYKFNQKFGKIEAVIGIALSVLIPQGQSEDVKKKLNAPIPDFSELKTNENIKTLVLANVTLTTLCKELHDDGDLITYLINLDAARVMLQELCSLLRNYTIVDPSDPV